MAENEIKVYEICPIYGYKYVVVRKKLADSEFDELTVDDENKLYSIERLIGDIEDVGKNDFNYYLTLSQTFGYKQVDRTQLGVNSYVVKTELTITDAELKVLQWCIKKVVVSIASIQRHFNISFKQVATLWDWMEQKKYIDPTTARDGKCVVTLTNEQFNKIYKQK